MMQIREAMQEAVLKPLEEDRDSKRYLLTGVLWLAVMVGLVILNQWLVRYLFKASYLGLYLKYGYLISLGFTLITLVINLDHNKDLISSHPFRYANACLSLIRVPLQVVGAEVRREVGQLPETHPGPKDSSAWDTPAQIFRALMSILDHFFSGFFSILFILLVSIWLWVVAPLQYAVYLICGAPARVLSKAHRRPALHETEQNPLALPADETLALPLNAEIDYFNKPVRMTSALAVLLLWVVAKFI